MDENNTREDVISKYEEYLLSNKELMDSLEELRGYDLGCYCAPEACHGDVLLKYANKKIPKKKHNGFEANLRLFLSSLSTRQCKFVYVNCIDYPNSIIISNADYELLTSFIPTQMSVSIVQFDESFYKEIINLLGVKDDRPYIFKSAILLKAIKDYKLEDVVTVHNNDGTVYLYQGNDIIEVMESIDSNIDKDFIDEDEEDDYYEDDLETKLDDIFTSSCICGDVVTDENALTILKLIVEDILSYIDDNIHTTNTSITELCNIFHLPVEEIEKAYSNVFKLNIGDIVLNLIDGLDIPSVKEFCKKQKLDKVNILTIQDKDSISTISYIETDDFKVYTCRPYNKTILKMKRRVTDE